jgi:hypothetical protein
MQADTLTKMIAVTAFALAVVAAAGIIAIL